MTSPPQSDARTPLYAVLFSTDEDIDGPYEPLVPEPMRRPDVTGPHGFDREVAAALPGLWYCLHLPASFLDTIDLPVRALQARRTFVGGHQILLAPIEAFDRDHLGSWPTSLAPVLVVSPDEHLHEAHRRSDALGFAFEPVGVSALSDATLEAHWRRIHARFMEARQYLGRPLTLAHRLDVAAIEVPTQHLARQFGADLPSVEHQRTNLDARVANNFRLQGYIDAIAALESAGISQEEAESRLDSAMDAAQRRLQVPVSLGVPGVAPAYARKSRDQEGRRAIRRLDEEDLWSPRMADRPDTLIERNVVEIMVTHRAVAAGGLGLMADALAPEAFSRLADLEHHFGVSPAGRAKAWRLLDRLDAVTHSLWEDDIVAAVSRSSNLRVYSNFPVGLLRLPGDTSPLTCRVPITYQPLTPLTRSLQHELSSPRALDISAGFQVLVAECIPAADAVGRLSRMGWTLAREMFRESGTGGSLDLADTPSIEALRDAIAREKPDILVISAHGTMDSTRQLAGLVIGNEVCLGPGLGPLPPVVILSACNTAGRGVGAINVADLLLREGAVAVLGAQVPVDVRRNSMLMVRLFVYMAEVLAGREQHQTLLDAWHRVQGSNAVNDILSSSARLSDWGRSLSRSGRPVVQEFMTARSQGRLRKGHVYRDTEDVLLELADEQGQRSWLQSTLRSQSYWPESAFYVFVGRPDRIYLRA